MDVVDQGAGVDDGVGHDATDDKGTIPQTGGTDPATDGTGTGSCADDPANHDAHEGHQVENDTDNNGVDDVLDTNNIGMTTRVDLAAFVGLGMGA